MQSYIRDIFRLNVTNAQYSLIRRPLLDMDIYKYLMHISQVKLIKI